MNQQSEIIKQSVTMPQILDMYGFKPNRAGFISCPFHSEKTASLRVYPNSFYCFGCGEGGDEISFVRKLFNLDFNQAIARIDSDFCLGILKNDKFSYREKQKYRKQMRQLKAKQAEQEAREEYSKYAYNLLICYRKWLMKQKPTEAILFDIKYIDRQLKMYLDRNKLIDWDIKARLTALMSKHQPTDGRTFSTNEVTEQQNLSGAETIERIPAVVDQQTCDCALEINHRGKDKRFVKSYDEVGVEPTRHRR